MKIIHSLSQFYLYIFKEKDNKTDHGDWDFSKAGFIARV
jgi:hypothetical protein